MFQFRPRFLIHAKQSRKFERKRSRPSTIRLALSKSWSRASEEATLLSNCRRVMEMSASPTSRLVPCRPCKPPAIYYVFIEEDSAHSNQCETDVGFRAIICVAVGVVSVSPSSWPTVLILGNNTYGSLPAHCRASVACSLHTSLRGEGISLSSTRINRRHSTGLATRLQISQIA